MQGIRAVQIALTERTLIVACDKFLNNGKFVEASSSIDPVIETLELVQVIPLKFVLIKLSRKGLHDKFYMKIIYKKRPKRCWKVYEFGGQFLKHFFWVVWNEKLRRMTDKEELFNNTFDGVGVKRIFTSSDFNQGSSEVHKFSQDEQQSSQVTFQMSFEESMINVASQFPSVSSSRPTTSFIRPHAVAKETAV